MSSDANILKQSFSYKFTIYKKLEFSGDSKSTYILIGPNGNKYLLNDEFYDHYDLELGKEIICRVDKINCSGQVFLEPEHPDYKVGDSYNFLIKEIKTGEGPWGNTLYTALVVDRNNKTWPCVLNNKDNIKPGLTEIICVVKKIKKGELTLMLKDYIDDMSKLIIGEFYKFEIVEEKIIDDDSYYVLSDPFGLKHMILKEYFSQFKFDIGQVISARVIDRWPDMSYKIEPNNPHYIIGGIYNFKVNKLDLVTNEIGEINGVYVLQDHYGQDTPVPAKSWQINNPKYKPGKIECRVINYKKGKLLLENIQQPG